MLFKASSNYAPFSTSGVTSGGVTLSIPGSLVLVEIRALILCLDVSSLSTSGSADAALSPMFLFSPVRVSEFVIFTKSLDWPDVFVFLLIILTTPNLSMVPVSLSVYASFSWVELLRLTRDPKSTCSSLSSSSSWDSPSFPVPTPMVNGKMFPKVFFTLSIKRRGICLSLRHACHHGVVCGRSSSCHNFSRDVGLSLSLSPFLLLLVLLAGSVFSQDPSGLSANQQTLPD